MLLESQLRISSLLKVGVSHYRTSKTKGKSLCGFALLGDLDVRSRLKEFKVLVITNDLFCFV